MLLLPVATFALRSAEPDSSSTSHEAASHPAAAAPAGERLTGDRSALPLSALRSLSRDARRRFVALEPWFLEAYLGGAALLSFRFLTGWAAAQRLRRENVFPAPACLEQAFPRLASPSRPRSR